MDKTKWYTFDHKLLEELESIQLETSVTQDEPSSDLDETVEEASLNQKSNGKQIQEDDFDLYD